MTAFERMPITTPERAMRDCMAADLGPALINQAIDDGRRSGRLTRAAANKLRSELRQVTAAGAHYEFPTPQPTQSSPPEMQGAITQNVRDLVSARWLL